VYALFQQGFREFLAHGQEQALAQLMHEVTPAFNAASQQARLGRRCRPVAWVCVQRW
jgi:hypothetical protein